MKDNRERQEAAPEEEANSAAAPASKDEEKTAVGDREMEALTARAAELERQVEEMRNRYLRAVADMDNARKRARQQIADAELRGSEDVLRDMLTVVDNLERALETTRLAPDASPEAQAVYDGVKLIYRQVLDLLARWDVKPIEAVGQQFDITRHEAVAQVAAPPGAEEGVVVEETQKGYMHGGRVLRPSKVVVGTRNAGQTSPTEPEKPNQGKR